MSNDESLLGTFPGRLFLRELRPRVPASIAAMGPMELISAATRAVGSYLYADECPAVLNLDVNREQLRDLAAAALAALSSLSTFGSPQMHQGALTTLHRPNPANRNPLSALPDGAFWTSTPLTAGDDSWTVSGENLRRDQPRRAVHFDETQVRLVRIDSAADWQQFIESNPVTDGGRRYPDWPTMSHSWDAVHLSPAGLLLAHPAISTTPLSCTDGSGLAHSRAGRYASVADWSAVSTAWLHEPPGAQIV
ncbi:hypothetical protein [Mycobacterium parmense]|uniref:Uncharacterized protein n=1 Tax=Mycobacterium parmense TaxID=185642 RepID=A0A7I7YSY3_9MYCO|nr:hypothetical protein [Mycobacterium parmense]MCV7348792.1 hypothetical protein [Mycobacterium parmense]ORW49659.1 hypothetical protein AWC20_03460 [Mycobacterium parmense]BBZ44302.1 hypothetical protein MPRM_15830 [Mycobacterium parmense]